MAIVSSQEKKPPDFALGITDCLHSTPKSGDLQPVISEAVFMAAYICQ